MEYEDQMIYAFNGSMSEKAYVQDIINELKIQIEAIQSKNKQEYSDAKKQQIVDEIQICQSQIDD